MGKSGIDMFKKLIILTILVLGMLPYSLYSQTKSAFSGEAEKFSQELRTFMGPNLNEENTANLNAFTAKWDSVAFSRDIMTRILDISSQLSSRLLRPVPHFDNYLKTLNYFSDYQRNDKYFENWLTGLSELAFSPRFSNDNLYMFLKNTSSMIKNGVIKN